MGTRTHSSTRGGRTLTRQGGLAHLLVCWGRREIRLATSWLTFVTMRVIKLVSVILEAVGGDRPCQPAWRHALAWPRYVPRPGLCGMTVGPGGRSAVNLSLAVLGSTGYLGCAGVSVTYGLRHRDHSARSLAEWGSWVNLARQMCQMCWFLCNLRPHRRQAV